MPIQSLARWAAITIAAMVLAGCGASRGGPISYDASNFKQPDAPRPAINDANYLIAAGDTLSINILEAKDLSRDYSVDTSGQIAMPLLGQVKVIGLTTQILASNISNRLNERYMRNPDVTISIKESTARNLTVDGAVRQPGVYSVVGETTLLQAVALARGTTEDANPRRVAIFRRISGQRMAAAFDLTDIRRGKAEDPSVYAGDIVVVDGNTTNKTLRDLFGTLPILALFRPY